MELHYESFFQKRPKETTDEDDKNNNNQLEDNVDDEEEEDAIDFLTNSIPTLSSNLWGSLTSIVGNVKQKSEGLLNIYKEDLQEFGASTLHALSSSRTESNNTNSPESSTTTITATTNTNNHNNNNSLTTPFLNTTKDLKNKISSSISSFISEYPNPHNSISSKNDDLPDASNNNNPLQPNQSNSAEKEIPKHLLTDIETYSIDPPDTEYQSFKTTFRLSTHQNEIINLLSGNSKVRIHYNYLVPSKVGEFDFWSRYYYRDLLKKEYKRKLELLTSGIGENEDDIQWDQNENKNDDTQIKETQTSNDNNVEAITKDLNEKVEIKEDPIIQQQQQQQPPQQQTQLLQQLQQQQTPINNEYIPVHNNNKNNNIPVNNNNNNVINNNNSFRTTPSRGELNDWEIIDKKSSDEEDWGAWE
eukprot:gene1171-1482_t